ncbi:MAG TPA: hypothetical protein VL137_00795 [Polyangiaceae bacterium]|nr:hypothetical protein [Polyangiaceae bacterium]
MIRNSAKLWPLGALCLGAVLSLSACGGVPLRGAQERMMAVNSSAKLIARYQVGKCADATGQALPNEQDGLSLYQTGDGLLLVSEPRGMLPVWIEQASASTDPLLFQMIAGGHLWQARLPQGSGSGQMALANQWRERPTGTQEFSAVPTRVVERCEVVLLQKPQEPLVTAGASSGKTAKR